MATKPTILLIGDSITQYGNLEGGWVHHLLEWYSIKADILNRGMSGYNTTVALPILQQVCQTLQKNSTGLVTICFGANDASTSMQHVDLQLYEQNVRQIVNMIKASAPNMHIVLITPPPVRDIMYDAFCQKQYSTAGTRKAQITKEYAEAVKQVAVDLQVHVVDLWPIFVDDTFFIDGLHLSAKGNEFFFKALKQAIVQNVPEMNAEIMPFPFASWSTLFK